MEGSSLEGESRSVKSFEEQFHNRQEIESLGGKVEVVDVTPESLKTEVPVIFAPGWGETPETFKDSIQAMTDLNRRVLSLEHARGGGNIDLGELKNEYSADELRKAFALLDVLAEKDINKADVIAHSEGAINTVIAAAFQPERFRSIVFVGPAGLIGEDKFPQLAGRFSLKLIQNALTALLEPAKIGQMAQAGLETTKYILKNPTASLKEAVAISNSDIHETLKELHEKGIGTAIIHGVDDPVFPMDKMQEVVNREQVDGFYSVKGGHDEIWAHPEKYVALAEQALEALAKKYETNQEK